MGRKTLRSSVELKGTEELVMILWGNLYVIRVVFVGLFGRNGPYETVRVNKAKFSGCVVLKGNLKEDKLNMLKNQTLSQTV